ncbi:MAG: ketoacyl-ACP synthase III [Candidatus Solibacter sp.]|nr:ketoacyl-ACP synthase III [Candidatus Solibacter sp.]
MPFIKEFGSYLPSRMVSSEEAGGWVDTLATWVFNVSGIEERRFAGKDETVSDMAVAAAKDCLQRAGLEAKDISMVLLSSGSSERQFPGPAAETALKLGIPGIPAIDLPLASAGALFALSLASRLTEQVGRVMVIAAEKMSQIAVREPMERGVAVLFGDGAGAALVTPDEGFVEVVDSQLASDGSFAPDLCLDWDQPLKMNGRTVILQASRKIPGIIRSLLERNAVDPQLVPVYLMHQANQNLIDRVADAIGVPAERFFSNIAKYGNTSSASMLIAASEWIDSHKLTKGDPVVFAAFGAGFHWGSLLARVC